MITRTKQFLTIILSLMLFSNYVYAYSCPGTPPEGKVCDETTHRWVKTQQDITLDSYSKECESEEFRQLNGFATKEDCFNQQAINRYQEDFGFSEAKKDTGLIIAKLTGTAAIIALAIISKEGGMFKGGCSTAMSLMAGAAAANAITDIYAWWKHKNQSEKMAEDYKNYAENQATENAQKKAFDFLAAEQDIVADVAKAKGTGYTIAALAYGAAAVAALFEAGASLTPAGKTAEAKTKACHATKASGKLAFLKSQTFILLAAAAGLVTTTFNFKNDREQRRNSTLDNNDSQEMKSSMTEEQKKRFEFAEILTASLWLDLIFPSANATSTPMMANTTGVSSVELGTTKSSVTSQENSLASTWLQASVAAAMAAITGVLADHSFEVSKTAEDRAKNLRKLASNFEILNTSCTEDESNGKTEPIKTTCYCYTWDADKQKYVPRTSDRSSSAKCNAAWYGSEGQYFAANDYTRDPYYSGKGCVSRGEFDRYCNCRKQAGTSGGNACDKVVLKDSTNGLLLSKIEGMPESLNTVSNYLNDNLDPGQLDITSLNGTRARTLRALEKVQNAINKKIPAGKPKMNLMAMAKQQYQRSLANTPAQVSSPVGTGDGSSNSQLASILGKKNLENITEAAKKADLKSASPHYNQAAPTTVKEEKKNDDFDFGLNGESNASNSGNQVQDIMDKNFNYKDNDIIKRPDQSIFKILSNRYINSGLKRLFEE